MRRLHAQGAVQAAVVFNQAGTAFVADMAGGVQAFAPDGKLMWRTKLDGGISATPVVHADDMSLFVATHAGNVFSLEAASGDTQWRRKIPSQSDPRILSDLLHLARADLVVFSTWGGEFHALEASTGRERFSWDAGISPWAAAASDDPENIYCLRARAGSGVEFVKMNSRGQEHTLLREPEDQRGARRTLVAAAPVVDENRAAVYLVLNQAHAAQLVAWSLKTGTELWRQRLPAPVQATPAVLADGEVVVADMAGSVGGFTSEGTLRFRYATGTEYLLAGAVGQADGTLWIGDPAGVVHALERRRSGLKFFEAPRSIQTRFSFDPFGRLYVPCTDQHVFVLAG